jgi:heme-degrading monooxygenase HmoA
LTYAIVWEFVAAAQQTADFEAAYGSDGPWARLFQRAPGFVETKLLRCEDRAGRYLTIDRWASLEAFEDFKRAFASDYQALDAQLEALTSTEVRLGGFDECTAASG